MERKFTKLKGEKKIYQKLSFSRFLEKSENPSGIWVFLVLDHSVWKSPKKYHSILRAKRATFTFLKVDKSSLKMPKMVNLATIWKPENYSQTVLPDMSILIGQKLMKNAKI